jgi:transposase
MEKIFCGIDFHKNESVLCVLKENGEMVDQITTIKSSRLVQYLSNKKSWTIGIEASGGTNEVATRLIEIGHNVVIINPNQFRGIGISGKKTDERDAYALANCLRLNFAPSVHLKSKFNRQIKTLITNREVLVRSRVNMCNHVRGTLREYGLTMPQGVDAFFENVGAKITEVNFPMIENVLRNLLAMIKDLKKQEDEVASQIELLLKENAQFNLLKTMPGIGTMTAAAMVSVVDDITRFPSAREFGSYLGLVPRVHSSAEKRMMGSITRSGPEILRRYLIHGARARMRYAVKPEDTDRRWAETIKERRGMNKAVVALAHRMARICFAMMRDEKPYHGRQKVKANKPIEVEEKES